LETLPGNPAPFFSGILRLKNNNRLTKNVADTRAVFTGNPSEHAPLLDAQAHGDLAHRIRDIPKLPGEKLSTARRTVSPIVLKPRCACVDSIF